MTYATVLYPVVPGSESAPIYDPVSAIWLYYETWLHVVIHTNLSSEVYLNSV